MPEEFTFTEPAVDVIEVPAVADPDFGETEPEPVFTCADCGDEHDEESEAEQCCWPQCPICSDRHEDQYEANHCCQFECPSCSAMFEYESDAEECCRYRCEHCGDSYDSEGDADRCCARGGDPYYPTLARVVPYQVVVDVLPNRPPRYISLEQELTGGGAATAAMLRAEGLGESGDVEDYSYTPSRGCIAVCEDGSLPGDGGEVKYSRFNLGQASDSARMSMALTKIRQLHKDAGIVSVGMSAGMHIHGSAKDQSGRVLPPVGMTALHELFSHCEDMIYGLAAAGWPRHRYSGTGNDYAKPIPKVASKTPWKVAQVMGSKYYGINFERLLSTVNSCRCGSVKFGSWSECECGAFDSATVEWRVFNTSTMPETVHAWVLFVSAAMELAHHHVVGTLRDQPFEPMGATDPGRRVRRMRTLHWFLRKAPLTTDEQDVILAAADRSPLLSTTPADN